MSVMNRPTHADYVAVLRGAFHPPLRDARFWILQASVILIAALHLMVDISVRNVSAFPDGIPVVLLVIPVCYAALRYGLSGSAATAVWASVLWLPDLLLPHDMGHSGSDLVSLLLVDGVGFFVGQNVEAERMASARVESAAVQLAAAEERYRQLFNTNSSPILIVGESGLITNANLAAFAVFGEGVIGRNGADALGQEIRGGNQIVTVEGGRDYRVNLIQLAGGTGGDEIQVVLEDVTQERIEGRRIRRYAEMVVRAEEDQRLRLSRELHDEPLQVLMHLARRLGTLVEGQGLPEELADALLELRQNVLDASAGLRAIATGLRPPALDQLGLVPALKGLLADVEDQSGIVVDLEVRGRQVRLPSEIELGAFRIVQESTSNAIRHARADQLSVLVDFESDAIELEISDNGHGFDPERLEDYDSGHLGMVGMRERARSLGGRFEIRSYLNGGTTVKVQIPLGVDAGGGILEEEHLGAEVLGRFDSKKIVPRGRIR